MYGLIVFTDRLAHAAAGQELLSGQPIGVVRCEEGSDGSDVAGLAGASERSLFDQILLEIGADEASGVRAFGFDHAGIDRVDTDLLRSKFAGENSGDGVDRAFGGGIDGAVGRSDTAYAGTNVDDAGAFFKVLDSGLGSEQNAQDIDVEEAMEGLDGDAFDGGNS